MVVNLAERTDRWERISGILSKHLPADQVVRVDAIKGVDLPGYKQRPWFRDHTPEKVSTMKAGAAGCCLSHRKAIEMARDAGYRRILLLEDDADFQNELDGPEGDAVASVLKDDSAWDMFYLGYYQKHNKHYVAKRLEIDGKPFELRRIRGPLMLHAAVIHERVFDAMLDGLPNPKNPWPWMAYWGSVDAWIQNRFGRDPRIRIWATEPKLVMQVATWSDICGRMLTEAESQGMHRPTHATPLDEHAFERSVPLSLGERCYQLYKYGSRRLKARLFGHKKT
ncbi:MAG: glycosyltransferase family 25 protein [Phycisphaeraceae bacterium]|nr:glycosyltransferase family 25 protein [Phycisphaeraceae bacterium]